MNEGWKCPVCSRGVAPGEKTCDHGGEGARAIPPDYYEMWRGLAQPVVIGPHAPAPAYDPQWCPPYKVTSVSGTVSARPDPTLSVWN